MIQSLTIIDIERELLEDSEWRKTKDSLAEQRQYQDDREFNDFEIASYNDKGEKTKTKKDEYPAWNKKEVDMLFTDDDLLLDYTEADVEKMQKFLKTFSIDE